MVHNLSFLKHHPRLVQWLAFAGLALAFLLLTSHAPRRVVEMELAVPALLLVASERAVGELKRQVDRGEPLAPLIAIVGCDGSGKSTLSNEVVHLLATDRPAQSCYLGLGTGDLGNRIRALPLVGPIAERSLSRKAARTRDKNDTIPGLATALVVFGLSLLRLWRFARVLSLRRRGVTVITDRYPQTEVAGFYDGPGLSAARAGGPVVAWLAEQERRLYHWMASFRPDIVLRLNVDADTAWRRKPDHSHDLLRAKVDATSLLTFGGARLVDIDARAPYAEVRREALARIGPILARSRHMGVAAE